MALISTLESVAAFLSLDCDFPTEAYDHVYEVLKFYFIGATSGLTLLAFVSDFFVKQQTLFMPILVVNCFQLAALVGFLIYEMMASQHAVPCYPIITIEGFFHAQAQFYLLFLTPLRIADKYRPTQEVTPAGTIIALNLCITQLVCLVVRSLVSDLLVLKLHASVSIQRLAPVVFLILVIVLVATHAFREYILNREMRNDMTPAPMSTSGG